jgi:hypothetical protein
MNKHVKTLMALVIASLSLAAYVTAQPATAKPAEGQKQVSKTVITEWKEYWGTPGETKCYVSRRVPNYPNEWWQR